MNKYIIIPFHPNILYILISKLHSFNIRFPSLPVGLSGSWNRSWQCDTIALSNNIVYSCKFHSIFLYRIHLSQIRTKFLHRKTCSNTVQVFVWHTVQRSNQEVRRVQPIISRTGAGPYCWCYKQLIPAGFNKRTSDTCLSFL